ncbi:NADPH-dependent FMN reductase family protein [Candidatus Desulfosporosinus infrequens]|uniref:NADPH-dependent FMN reductase family protein n=1 Tax=Candidatus Desulfosporosinus infrequens TaxID=2043169 RepID=A0A2U3KCS8_9FIRM|nr:NADPH-dependent FMN reductase family protein [Candidatus Desulfosporosinus infrequens]
MTLAVLGIACSPRRNGNSTRLLLEGMETAKAEGHTTELVYLSDLKISPCHGCNACSAEGICVIKDDILKLREKLIQADRLIIAAPIFMMGLNAQTKIIIDRMQPFWALKYLHHQTLTNPSGYERVGLYLGAAGLKKPDVFDCGEKTMKTFFHMLDFRYAQPCLFGGIDQAGEINKHPTAFDEVRKATQVLMKS